MNEKTAAEFLDLIKRDVTEDIQSRYFYLVDNAELALMIKSFGLKAQEIGESFNIDSAIEVMEQAHNKGLMENIYIGCMDKASNDQLKAYCEEQYLTYKEGWSIFYKKEYLKSVSHVDELRQALADYVMQQEGCTITKCEDGTFKQVEIKPPVDVKATYNVQRFIDEQLQQSIYEYKQGENIKTGFANLDLKAGSIHAGLYVLGAVSSLGKTTFMHQIADQLTEQGENVLYFSLEQSTFELVSKSLSRKTAQLNYDKAISSLDIRYGKTNSTLEQAKAVYGQNTGRKLSIIEGNFGCTAAYIREMTENFIKQTGIRPTVIVDYLQIIAAPETLRTTDTKAITDTNITELKRISRDNNIPVFVISSFNRDNYLQTADFSSFKESGAIEYTADVVWALQLACITHDPLFKEANKINEKRELVSKEKAKLPRNIELVCLKNRYGLSNYKADFEYYPNYDLFKPHEGKFEPLVGKSPFDNAKTI